MAKVFLIDGDELIPLFPGDTEEEMSAEEAQHLQDTCPLHNWPEEDYPILFAFIRCLVLQSPCDPEKIVDMLHSFAHNYEYAKSEGNAENIEQMKVLEAEEGIVYMLDQLASDLHAQLHSHYPGSKAEGRLRTILEELFGVPASTRGAVPFSNLNNSNETMQ